MRGAGRHRRQRHAAAGLRTRDVALTRKGISEVERYTPGQVREKYGLEPPQIIDLKGLMGDPSRQIPGVPGVGEKTALKLLHEYGRSRTCWSDAGESKGKMKENIEAHRTTRCMSKKLATIYREVPMEHDLDDLRYNGYDGGSWRPPFRKLEFKSLLDRLAWTRGASRRGRRRNAEAESRRCGT